MYVTYMYLEPHFCLYFRSGQPSKTPKFQSKQGSFNKGVLGQQKVSTPFWHPKVGASAYASKPPGLEPLIEAQTTSFQPCL